MARVEPRVLARYLTPTATRMLEAAVGRAGSAQHYEVTVEHVLQQILEPEDGDAAAIFHHLNKNKNPLKNRVDKIIQHMRTGNASRPTFSGNLWNWIEDAWLIASLELGHARVRTGVLIYTLIRWPARHTGEEFALVLEGAVELHTELYAPARLEAGDSIYFDSTMGHAYLAAAPGRCRVLAVCSGGEAHLREAMARQDLLRGAHARREDA